MDRAYLSNTSGTPPLPPAVPAIGFPQAGNPATSQKATRPGMYWYYMITESLRNIVIAAGLEPDHENLGQVVEALGKMFLGCKVNEWQQDADGRARLFFESDNDPAHGTTYYMGHGDVAHEFRNKVGGVLACLYGNGKLTLPSLALAANDNSSAVPDTAWVQALVSSALLYAVPVGTSILYAGNTPPSGFVRENGALLSRTTYSTLYAAIGTIYGAGDGVTTFAVPESRGEGFRALDDGRGVDVGRTMGSPQAAYAGSIPWRIGADDGDADVASYKSISRMELGGVVQNANDLAPSTMGPYQTAVVTPGDTRMRNVPRLALIRAF